MVWQMIELLLTTVLTCREANMIATRAILNNNIPTPVIAEIVYELRQVTIPECVLPDIERG